MTATTPPSGQEEGRTSSICLRDTTVYKDLFVNPWTYVTGAVILALMNIVLMASTGSGWGVTGAFVFWAADAWNWLGGDAHSWPFFNEVAKAYNKEGFTLLADRTTIMDLGVIVGALLATLLASQFRIKSIKSGRQVAAAVIGGTFMGVGARLAFGCNIGAMFTGLPAMSLHGWVFIVFIFIGAAVGSRLLVKYFI